VAEWVFPINAFTRSIRLTAELRGQLPNRIEIRDPGDRWPEFVRVKRSILCPQRGGIFRHEPKPDSFCVGCDRLVEGG